MSKQADGDRTLELKMPARRGRPSKFASAADKQRAYRERRKAEGKSTDSRGETIAQLKAEIEALKTQASVKPAPADSSAKARAKLGQTIATLESKVMNLEYELRDTQFRRNTRLADLASGLKLKKRHLEDLFLKDRDGQTIALAYEAEHAVKAAQEFGRKSSVAASAIGEIQDTLQRREMIGVDESAILTAARRILTDIHNGVTNSKDWVKTVSTRIHHDDAARKTAAKKAVTHEFQASLNECGESMWLWAVATQIVRPEGFTKYFDHWFNTKSRFVHWLKDQPRDIQREIESQVVWRMEKGITAAAAIEELKAKVDATRPRLEREAKLVREIYEREYANAAD